MSRYFPRFLCSMSRLSWVGLSSTADPTIPQQLSGILEEGEAKRFENMALLDKLYWFRRTTQAFFLNWGEYSEFPQACYLLLHSSWVTSSDYRIVWLIACCPVHELSSCRIPTHPTGMDCFLLFGVWTFYRPMISSELLQCHWNISKHHITTWGGASIMLK